MGQGGAEVHKRGDKIYGFVVDVDGRWDWSISNEHKFSLGPVNREPEFPCLLAEHYECSTYVAEGTCEHRGVVSVLPPLLMAKKVLSVPLTLT